MSRLGHESFDLLSPTQLQDTGKWLTVGSGVVATTGRNGSGVTGTNGATQAQNTLRSRAFSPGTPNEGYCGLAVKCTSLPAAEQKVWAVLDSAGTALVTATIATDGKVKGYRGTEAGTLLGTSASAFVAAGSFRYLQFGFDWDANTFQVLSTISGGATSLLSTTPTLSSPNPWVYTEIYLTDTIVVDDYYVNDGLSLATEANVSYFSGDTSIVVVVPASVSSHTAYFPWTANSGSDLAAPIDDSAMDSDGTYIYTRDSYSRIAFQMGTVTDDGRRVDAVQPVAIARQVSSSWAPALRILQVKWNGLVTYLSGDPINTTAYKAMMGRDADKDWTIARVNASKWGVES